MAVTPNDPRPPYVQVADDLRTAITSGRYAPGERLPSGRDLAREYGVALMTMQRALTALAEEGHVALYKSRGAFVRSIEPSEARPTLDELTVEVRQLRETVAGLTQRLDQVESRTGIAERAAREAVATGDGGALTSLAALLADQGRTDEAEQLYRRAVDAGYHQALASLAGLLASRGDAEEAEKLYRRAISAGHRDANVNLAALLENQGRTEEAEKHYRRAVNAGYGEALAPLAALLAARGESGEAEQLYRHALAISHGKLPTDLADRLGLPKHGLTDA